MSNSSIKIFGGIIVILGFGAMYIYLHIKYNFGIPCFFYQLTGWHCPGCGSTRAIVAALNGEFYQAFRYNPILPFWLIYMIGMGGIITKEYVMGITQTEKVVQKRNIGMLIFLIIVIWYWFFRNTSWGEFLQPTKL